MHAHDKSVYNAHGTLCRAHIALHNISKLPTGHSVSDVMFISAPSAPLGVLRTAETQRKLNMMARDEI